MPAATTAARWPLVGRRSDLDGIERALDDPDCRAVLIHGAPGVGKTRLAEEALEAAERAGRATRRATASAAAATVPLGALAHLFGAVGVSARIDGPELFRRAADALQTEANERIVLMIDDVHLLDATSTTLLGHVLDAGLVDLVGTIRAGEPMPDAIATLWRGDHALRVDLEHLRRESVETLLYLALGYPIDGAMSHALWEATHGNVLFLRELVLGAQESGTMVLTDGIWQLTGPLTSSVRLVELIATRLTRVDAHGRTVLELLASCEPVGLLDLEAAAPQTVLEGLEQEGLIVVRSDGRREVVTLSHPLHGEVLRSALTRLRARSILNTHADRIAAYGARRREDPLRLATWRLDATGAADHDLLVEAAHVARYAHDFVAVVRLAGAALAVQFSAQAALLLGEAYYELGSFDDAERVLAGAYPGAASDDERLRIVASRTTNLVFGLVQPEEALAVNRAAHTTIVEPDARHELLANEASILMFSGHPADALELLGDLEPTGEELRTRVVRSIPEAPALAVVGRSAEALSMARRAFEEHSRLGDDVAIAHPGTHIVTQVFALADLGSFDEAFELGAAGYEVATAARVPIAQIWFCVNLGRVSLLRGRPATARRWYREGLAVTRAVGFVGPRELAFAGVAASTGMLGDGPGVFAITEECVLLPGFGFLRPEMELGPAWARIAVGDLTAALEVLDAGADRARSTEHRTSESWLLHDAARIGDAARVAPRLAELADLCEGPLVAARARHARALADGDLVELTAALDAFEALDCRLAAAECAVSAADAARRGGERRAASQPDRKGNGTRPWMRRRAHPGSPHRGGRRPLVEAGVRDCAPRRGWHREQVDRRAAVPFGPHGQQPSAERVREAGRDEPRRPVRRAGIRGGTRMTPEQIELVKASFVAMQSRADELTETFYEMLFAADPSTRVLFTREPSEQRAVFLNELRELVRTVGRLEEFRRVTEALGARHAGYGVEVHHYASVGQALLGAIEQVLGDDATPETMKAWRLTYDLVAETMMAGAAGRPA